MRYLFITLFFSIILNTIAQQKNTDTMPKIIFKKEIKPNVFIEQSQIANMHGEDQFTIILYNTKIKKQITIDSVRLRSLPKELKLYGVLSAIDYSKIIEVCVIDSTIYLIHNIGTEIYLNRIDLSKIIVGQEEDLKKEQYLLGDLTIYPYRPIPHFFAHIKPFGSKVFIYARGSQYYGKEEFLGYYDTNYKELQQYQFSKKPKRIKDTQRIGDKIQRDLLLTEQNTYNLITLSMKQLLVDEGKIKHPNYFEYLFTIDGCSNNERTRDGGDMLYIFYREELHYGDIKIMQYDNTYPDYAWLIDDSVTRRTIEPIKIPNK